MYDALDPMSLSCRCSSLPANNQARATTMIGLDEALGSGMRPWVIYAPAAVIAVMLTTSSEAPP